MPTDLQNSFDARGSREGEHVALLNRNVDALNDLDDQWDESRRRQGKAVEVQTEARKEELKRSNVLEEGEEATVYEDVYDEDLDDERPRTTTEEVAENENPSPDEPDNQFRHTGVTYPDYGPPVANQDVLAVVNETVPEDQKFDSVEDLVERTAKDEDDYSEIQEGFVDYFGRPKPRSGNIVFRPEDAAAFKSYLEHVEDEEEDEPFEVDIDDETHLVFDGRNPAPREVTKEAEVYSNVNNAEQVEVEGPARSDEGEVPRHQPTVPHQERILTDEHPNAAQPPRDLRAAAAPIRGNLGEADAREADGGVTVYEGVEPQYSPSQQELTVGDVVDDEAAVLTPNQLDDPVSTEGVEVARAFRDVVTVEEEGWDETVAPDDEFDEDYVVEESGDVEVEEEDDDNTIQKPKRNDSKAKWVAYANRNGTPNADTFTRDELADLYEDR